MLHSLTSFYFEAYWAVSSNPSLGCLLFYLCPLAFVTLPASYLSFHYSFPTYFSMNQFQFQSLLIVRNLNETFCLHFYWKDNIIGTFFLSTGLNTFPAVVYLILVTVLWPKYYQLFLVYRFGEFTCPLPHSKKDPPTPVPNLGLLRWNLAPKTVGTFYPGTIGP